MIKRSSCLVLFLVTSMLTSSATAEVPRIGVVADTYNKVVNVFDWTYGTKLGSVPIPHDPDVPTLIGDCIVTADGSTAYVSDYNYQIWVIDLTQSPPALAAGTNPIVVSSPAQDIAISPDERFLVASGGSEIGTFGDREGPAVSVDLATRTQLSQVFLPRSPNSIEICDDGETVIVTAPGTDGFIAKLLLDSNGNLSNTGETIPNIVGKNSTCVPGSQFVIVGSLHDDIYVVDLASFTILSSHTTTGQSLVTIVTSPSGDRIYIRSRGVVEEYESKSIIEVFDFDTQTGFMNPTRLLDIPIDSDISGQGLDKLAISPDGNLLFVPVIPGIQTLGVNNPELSPYNRLVIHDAYTGEIVHTIFYINGTLDDPGIVSLTGVAVTGPLPFLEASIDIAPEDPLNEINLNKDKHVDVIVFSDALLDATQIDPGSVLFADAPIQQRKNGNIVYSLTDADGDGLEDFSARFSVSDLQLDTAATSATLIGATYEGTLLIGSDAVVITTSTRGGGKGNGKGPKNK